MQDTTTLDDLLGAYPGYDKISAQAKASALNLAVIPDSEGRLPGSEGYQPTYDYAYAAILLLPALQAQAQATAVTSESTSVSTTVADWRALRTFLASMSPICRGQQGVFQVAYIPVEEALPAAYDSRLGVDHDVE